MLLQRRQRLLLLLWADCTAASSETAGALPSCSRGRGGPGRVSALRIRTLHQDTCIQDVTEGPPELPSTSRWLPSNRRHLPSNSRWSPCHRRTSVDGWPQLFWFLGSEGPRCWGTSTGLHAFQLGVGAFEERVRGVLCAECHPFQGIWELIGVQPGQSWPLWGPKPRLLPNPSATHSLFQAVQSSPLRKEGH